MKQVFFKTIKSQETQEISDAAKSVLDALIESHGIEFEDHVPIKVHFGEKGNTTFVPAACYDGIIDVLNEQFAETSYIETNVLYRGARTTRESHIKVAEDHGFTQVPIIIADGERGEAYYEVEINKTHFKTCKIGQGYQDFDQMIVCSHFKGHGMAGFGGAVKQLSMGFASRGGKMAQHAKMVPSVSKGKCTACGLCIEKCDVNAISMVDKAQIHDDKCIGCAGCIAVCPVGAIRNDWSADNFKEKVAEYAYAAQLDKDFVYITFLMNITEECDCMGQHMTPIAKDIGVFASLDPVAIDKACYDMLASHHGHPLFTPGLQQLEHGQKIGLGAMTYELVSID